MFGKLLHADDWTVRKQLNHSERKRAPSHLNYRSYRLTWTKTLQTSSVSVEHGVGLSERLKWLHHDMSYTKDRRDGIFYGMGSTAENGKTGQWLKLWLKHRSNLISISVLFWHNWNSFHSCHLLIEFSSRISASPPERGTVRGGHYGAFLD